MRAMAGLKNWGVFQLLLLFFSLFPCFLDALIDYPSLPSVNNSTSWKNHDSSEQQSWRFTDGSTIRPILFVADIYRETYYPPFGFGFFANGTTTSNCFYLVVFFITRSDDDFILSPPIVAWSANRDNPVRENATLDFNAEGDLKLKDADGSLVWSSNTSSLSVTHLNLTSEGNLMLLRGDDTVIWQSFDYPTDVWLPNQNISVGKGLIARNSSSNLTTGFYYLLVTSSGIDAFISSDPPQMYRPLHYTVSQLSASNSIPLGDSVSIEGQSNSALFFLPNITVTGFQYLILEPTGHLNLYRLDRVTGVLFNVVFSDDLLSNDIFGECDYPTVCGNYGVCSEGQCSCPGGNSSYFTQTRDLQPTLGCREVTPLSCEDEQLHNFLELKNVTYFNLETYNVNMDPDSCKKACLDNCTCKAAFSSSGQCSLQSHLYSLKNDVNYDSLAFIKVQGLPGRNRSPDNKKSYLIPILVPALCVGLVIILVLLGYYYRTLINSEHDEEDGDDGVTGGLKRFSFLELKSATHDFQVRLGRGGFGSVFEGDFDDGTKVAVKHLDSIGQGRKEFLAEVNTIGSIHHFNLVRLIGYCAEKSNRLLVYELMSNGSLDKWIFNPERTQTLSWEIRRKIIIGLAKGLEYLHMHCTPSIIHFDIKPQNILLDGEFNVKISDFGLAKLIDRDQSQVVTVVKGTPGYVAPELFKGTNISVKADIFSFGIVMLEIVFGRKNFSSSHSEQLIDIANEKAERNQLHDLADGFNEDIQCHKEEAMKMIKIAIWCLQAHSKRPSMSTVLKVLEDSVDVESIFECSFLTIPQTERSLQANSFLLTNSTLPAASILSGPR